MTDSSPEDAALPTVVLVHGAFADAGSWAAVTERLVRGRRALVRAIVNPLRGVRFRRGLRRERHQPDPGTGGSRWGHSYGGAVITNAVPHTTNVVGLVYVAAFAPDEGELSRRHLVASSKDSVLLRCRCCRSEYPAGWDDGDRPRGDRRPRQVPRGIHGRPASSSESDVLAVSQRPDRCRRVQREEQRAPGVGRTCRRGRPSEPRTRPPGTDAVMSMARACSGATITEIPGTSHVITISQPDAVTKVILAALKATSPRPSLVTHA